ncbi:MULTISPECIES: RES family NAD+ phosphorylase [Raoultella]|nr:RES family NAD+ phosphorylase [Raoultella ornithinolytica]
MRSKEAHKICICLSCIEEPYLHSLIEKKGKKHRCHYCGDKASSFSLDVITEMTETAISQHYIRTAADPSDMEYAMSKHCDHEWYRKGEEICQVIADLLHTDSAVARDIQQLLEEKHSDRDCMIMGEETEFASGSQYMKKTRQDTEDFDVMWRQYVRSLKTQSRYVNPSVTATLDGIFAGIDQMKSRHDQSVIMDAGPDTALNFLYRARYSAGHANLEQILVLPDRELGPPPHRFSGSNRMSARGISVFYGASTVKTAISEIRPPVGCKVVSARFNLIRPLRLLNLPALENVWQGGSMLDPEYIKKRSQVAFLHKLTSRLVVPVLPGEEDFDYIPTQVIAEYLADDTGLALDGMLYPSVQQSGEVSLEHFNVVLFHKASCVHYLNFPDKKDCHISYGHAYSEEDWEDDICVTHIQEYGEQLDLSQPYEHNPLTQDIRPPALKIDLSSVCVHDIQKVCFKFSSLPVRRDTDVIQPSFRNEEPDNVLWDDTPFQDDVPY